MRRVTVHLTPRECEVVRGIIAGLNNREIAEKLGLAEQSIKNILSITYQKCQVRNRLELMLFAIKHDILSH